MTHFEREMLRKLMLQSITKEDFLKDFTENIVQNNQYLMNLLEEAYNEKQPYDVEYLVIAIFKFNIFTGEFVDVLCKLIEATWHYQHENIAMLLQKIKSPRSVESLYQTVNTQFEYLEFDESYALAVKCIWALGDIATEGARIKLGILAESKNEIIRDNALNQLKRNL